MYNLRQVVSKVVDLQSRKIVDETEDISNVFRRHVEIQRLIDSFGDGRLNGRIRERVCELLAE